MHELMEYTLIFLNFNFEFGTHIAREQNVRPVVNLHFTQALSCFDGIGYKIHECLAKCRVYGMKCDSKLVLVFLGVFSEYCSDQVKKVPWSVRNWSIKAATKVWSNNMHHVELHCNSFLCDIFFCLLHSFLTDAELHVIGHDGSTGTIHVECDTDMAALGMHSHVEIS